MNVIRSAITGEYEPKGDPKNADCLIGLSFGAAENDPGYVNQLLSDDIRRISKYILEETNISLPLLLQQEIAAAMPSKVKTDFVIEGELSSMTGKGLDSWAVLNQALEYMKEHNLERPIIAAQAYHIGRVALQAVNLGMDPIIIGGMTKEFDPESSQIWTRSKYLWVPRELVAITYLKANDKI
ncbi:MAG: hypothetical protein WCQ49_01655 [Candidatus Saccharibacteria bacterium]